MRAIIFYCLFFCLNIASAQQRLGYRSSYDDSTLRLRGPLALMPFNRLIHSAGKVLTFGDPKLENHALDVTVMPGDQFVAVEDRYGIVVVEAKTRQIKDRWTYDKDMEFAGFMSTYCGIKSLMVNGKVFLAWGAAGRGSRQGALIIASWNGMAIVDVFAVNLPGNSILGSTLPNDIAIAIESGVPYIYIVLNGANQLAKLRFTDKQLIWTAPTGVAPYGIRVVNDKAYVTNWAGPQVVDTTRESAGTPTTRAYTNPSTGGTAAGTLSIIDTREGKTLKELPLGLHPNAIIVSPDMHFLYVSNGSNDQIDVIDIRREEVIDSIPVGLFSGIVTYYGSSPNALQLDPLGTTLYIANGFDNAICVVSLGQHDASNGKGSTAIKGYIPTEAYPGGIVLLKNTLFVANIEATGSRVLSSAQGLHEDQPNSEARHVDGFTIHQELASLSIIPLPSNDLLGTYTQQVKRQNLLFRVSLTNLPPRQGVAPKPLPQRVGEPSVFKHVVYIIKENKTYDQVFGDLPKGRGLSDLCIYGNQVTPNQHRLVNDFLLLDNYYASGKSSAEGHQWVDAAMVSDYIEKSVRAWFRSYPHRQEDALVYNKNGFLWNNALDHGKQVRVYGEACTTHYDKTQKWLDIYNRYLRGEDQGFSNTTTIGRLRPIISPDYPDCANLVFSDQIRADIFLQEWKAFELLGGDKLPDLMVLSLPNDHTAGTAPGFPAPNAMVADNDLAVGRIVEAITHSRFWDSTVIFITEDDSQSGWDHISPYRTIAQVISPYSAMGRTIHTNYNQTSMVRTIEQILGIPPLTVIDATALPMFDCFGDHKSAFKYDHLTNNIPLNQMNKGFASLKGQAYYYARLSAGKAFKEVDGGDDADMNKILWYDAKGKEKYPNQPH